MIKRFWFDPNKRNYNFKSIVIPKRMVIITPTSSIKPTLAIDLHTLSVTITIEKFEIINKHFTL